MPTLSGRSAFPGPVTLSRYPALDAVTVTDMETSEQQLPYVSLVASPGRRRAVIDAALDAERRGFPGVAAPGLGAAMALCTALAVSTTTLRFLTAIQPIYLASANETGMTASLTHELSGGRFVLGLGVSHAPMNKRVTGARPGAPLADTRDYVGALRELERFGGELPPIHLAGLRDRMLGLAGEVAQGAIWANASLRHTIAQIGRIDGLRNEGFGRTNMIPCVIDDDRTAAAAVNRKTMAVYVGLPNYRNYWREAGYVDEMDAIERALEAGERDRVTSLMSDAWLADCTLFGTAAEVRDGLSAWYEAGITPIAVMSSTSGGQLKAVGELFAAYA
jgi:alkanesulfonate monooxygenase SsuD/methylene tetrahydromethanopterin reductase-like flavin-dependent oxidoreductase (luciferase family)